jgi:hypothetical protein
MSVEADTMPSQRRQPGSPGKRRAAARGGSKQRRNAVSFGSEEAEGDVAMEAPSSLPSKEPARIVMNVPRLRGGVTGSVDADPLADSSDENTL